jgi:hypothetical protein
MFALRRGSGNAQLEWFPGAFFSALAFLGVRQDGLFSSYPKSLVDENAFTVENRDLRNSKPYQT